MEIVQLIQGTTEWHAHRAKHFNASDAPAMMGASPYKTRSQLIKELATGYSDEVDAATKKIFYDGHRFEALARPRAEEIVGEELFPVVGVLNKFSASFDGLTMSEEIAFEHKSLNNDIRECEQASDLPLHFRIQMEQQLMVCAGEKVLFMATKWDEEGKLLEEKALWYSPDFDLREKIVAGWKQLEADVAAYVPQEVIPAAVAAPQMALPAVTIQVQGAIALTDNLTVFSDAFKSYLDRINKKPETDQDFADLEATVKTLKATEEALEAAKNNALGQVESIDLMKRTVEQLQELARTNRLAIDKLVKAEKENRRAALLRSSQDALADHIKGLNERLGKPYMPPIYPEFQDVIKGLKSLDSMKDKLATELARCKIEANAVADLIDANLKTLRELAADHAFLFADTAQIVLKSNDDLTALVKTRIADHKAAEEKRLESDRLRIRAEEEAKAAVKVKAEAETTAKAQEQPAVAAPVEAPKSAEPIATEPAQVVHAAPAHWQDVRNSVGHSLDRLSVTQLQMVAEYIAKLSPVKAAA